MRRWDSGESDRRVALLTSERGKIYAVARGARKAKARLAGVSEPLMHVSFGIATGRKNNYITQAQPLESFAGIRRDYSKLLCALAWTEALDALLPELEPQPEAFELCLVALRGIEAAREPLGALCWADLKLLELSGFGPTFSVSVVSGAALSGEIAISPSLGGAILAREAGGTMDAKPVQREIVLTLAKVQALDSPPDFVKRADEVTRALLPFWKDTASRELPARQNLVESLS